MCGGSEVTQRLSVDEIRSLGLDWPKYTLIEAYCIVEGGKVDLARSLEAMRSSRAFHKRQIGDAYAFKMQTGADYADFTNRFDDHVRMEHQLGQAISYLEHIIEAAEEQGLIPRSYRY